MKSLSCAVSLSILTLSAPALAAGASARLDVKVDGITDNAPIPPKYALCIPTADGKSEPGDNYRPGISWSNVPNGTKSFAILVTDPDVPADFDNAGKEGKVVAKHAKRQLFYHWALADIPPETTQINGDAGDVAPLVGTRARNSLGAYIKDSRNYGGPCPPWNDERVHTYHFTVYALSEPTLKLGANPEAEDIAEKLKGNVLAAGSVVGTYSLNPSIK